MKKIFPVLRRTRDKRLCPAGRRFDLRRPLSFVGEISLNRLMREKGFAGREGAIRYLENTFGKEVLVLPGPDPHQDRYHLPLGLVGGRRTSLLADPAEVLQLLLALTKDEKKRAAVSFSEAYLEQGDGLRPHLEHFFEGSTALIEEIRASVYAGPFRCAARACPYLSAVRRI